MKFQEEKIVEFLAFFSENKNTIQSFEGCTKVNLLQDKKDATIFFTYSIWEDEKYLEQYRQSDFFKKTWSTVTQWHAERAAAWSVEEIA